MGLVEAVVTGIVGLAIVCFALYVVALFRLPADRRPRTSTIDRFGQPLPPAENPGYEETEEERRA